MLAFIAWSDWQKLTPEQREAIETYGERLSRNTQGIAFEIEQYRIDEILAMGETE